MEAIDWADKPLINNKEGLKKRFELHLGNQFAFIDYILNKNGVIFLTHTEVPENLEGRGMGSAIVSKTLEYIRAENLKMAPLCPFVAAYLKDHPGIANDLLAPGFSIA